MEYLGTPYLESPRLDLSPFTETNWFLLIRCEANHVLEIRLTS